nr:MAG TPA: Protein of unknown function (DUF3270) [Bacteriophage sp.]
MLFSICLKIFSFLLLSTKSNVAWKSSWGAVPSLI